MSNVNCILFSHVVMNRMFGGLERLCAYKKKEKMNALDSFYIINFIEFYSHIITFNF